MIIRKKFDFEASHIVRNCHSERCKYSIHGHSFELELFLTANRLDNGQMIYDFGLLKQYVKMIIDSFDHSFLIWNADSPSYQKAASQFSARLVTLPFSPSAEMLSLFFLKVFTRLFTLTHYTNNETNVIVSSVRLHETKSGYAESFAADLLNQNFPQIPLDEIIFSKAIILDWHNDKIWMQLVDGSLKVKYKEPEQQVALTNKV